MTDDMRRGLVGDLHGNERWARYVLRSLAEAGIKRIYQAGDFGLWPGHWGKRYLAAVIDECRHLGITLWIVPGNHEDYTQIVDPEGPVPEKQVLAEGTLNGGWEVSLLPRGYRWEDGGRSFVALGGAPSIDFPSRVHGVSFWPEEKIRESDLDRLEEGPEIMLAHDAPTGGTDEVEDIVNGSTGQANWTVEGLEYAEAGRKLMTRAFDIVKPRVFIHGHYHVSGMKLNYEKDCLFVSLDSDGFQGNVAVLDLADLSVTYQVGVRV